MNTSLLSTLARLLLTVPFMVASLTSYAAEVVESSDKEEKPVSEAVVTDRALQVAQDSADSENDDEESEAVFTDI
ncbi:hypothetical protein [Candidatus Sororendozoicomonas aggregata]|uniref:hypothetical protein n=1 Tax=Candidatus Sororendozoicomonas aggregata TaxID=3073239 RepID=UPI002ED054B6